MSNAFDRYAPFVQEFIYRNDWQKLRAIQVAAADAIFRKIPRLRWGQFTSAR